MPIKQFVPHMSSVVDYLEHWAAVQPDKCLSSFFDVYGKETETYTYLSFNERSRLVAEYLSRQAGIKRGERALLVYPPGLEVIVAFIACARIGAIPVPVYPPTPMNFKGSLAKLRLVAHDCRARAALTTCELHRCCQNFMEHASGFSFEKGTPFEPELDWIETDELRGQASKGFCNDAGPVLFLQYTSGSTSDPKGVIVSHENVIHNCLATLDHTPIGVSWLPQYHDMGLIGYYLFPLITGGTTYGFSPTDFLKRPLLWLEAMSRVRATYSSSPNFGFKYCLREDKIPSDRLAELDLSSLKVLMNASEPVCAETYSRFLERFASCGLRPSAHLAAYGLAENTLAVTHYGRRIVTVDKRLFKEGRVEIESTNLSSVSRLSLVSCGRPLEGVDLRIVDPESLEILGEKRIGEIWLEGKSTCRGYWNRSELSREVFGNKLGNGCKGRNGYLRTGDLGFMEGGELFVCGRIKDLIIIRGINYYPQDIERVVESASQKIRSGGVAAFDGGEEEGSLVVVAEVRARRDLPDPAPIFHAIRTHFLIEPEAIVFVSSRTIARTTSGKIARNATRNRWLNGELPTIAIHITARGKELAGGASSGLRERFRYIIEPYNLTGNEKYSLAEIGIDSLALVGLLSDIEQLLEEHGAADLAGEVDGRLLLRLSVADFFLLLDQMEKTSKESGSPLSLVLKRLRKEYDDHERDCMRLNARFSPTGRIEREGCDRHLESVFMTGATGFFGPFLLSSLLLKTPYTYYVLVRAADRPSAMERIRGSLRRAGLLTPSLGEEVENRVHVVCGDISKNNLGIGEELWKLLSTRVQAVIHNGAMVNYVLNYEALRPHNVDGTRELLRFAFTGAPKVFHHISSTIIFGWTSKGELMETEANQDMLNLDFGYAQSKWVAEQLVFGAQRQGLKVRVYRPAFISASTGGIASSNDIVIRLLAFMINHGIAVKAANQISFLPADFVAENIAAIFKVRQIEGSTLHVTAGDYYNMADVTRMITQEYGYPFIYYDIPGFVAQMNRLCTKNDPIYPLLDFFNRSHTKIASMQQKRYNNQSYCRARELCGKGGAEPTLKETVSYLMAYMLREGIIPKAAQVRAPQFDASRTVLRLHEARMYATKKPV